MVQGGVVVNFLNHVQIFWPKCCNGKHPIQGTIHEIGALNTVPKYEKTREFCRRFPVCDTVRFHAFHLLFLDYLDCTQISKYQPVYEVGECVHRDVVHLDDMTFGLLEWTSEAVQKVAARFDEKVFG